MQKALVCEDDAIIRGLLEVILTRGGLAVHAVPDGAQALEALLEHEYDLIVLDLMMPVLSGGAVLDHLESSRPDLLPRIVITTAASPAVLQHRNVGAVVPKPFDVAEFASLVKRMTGN